MSGDLPTPMNEAEAERVFAPSRALHAVFNPSAAALPRIKLQGEEYVFVGDGRSDGAITKRADFEAGAPSYAHLFEDGRILRFRKQIGVREDIEWLP